MQKDGCKIKHKLITDANTVFIKRKLSYDIGPSSQMTLHEHFDC